MRVSSCKSDDAWTCARLRAYLQQRLRCRSRSMQWQMEVGQCRETVGPLKLQHSYQHHITPHASTGNEVIL